jgi:hypothetical protein
MWWQRKTSTKTHDDLVAALKNAPDEIVIEGDPIVIASPRTWPPAIRRKSRKSAVCFMSP